MLLLKNGVIVKGENDLDAIDILIDDGLSFRNDFDYIKKRIQFMNINKEWVNNVLLVRV